jgi:hypothetical protein
MATFSGRGPALNSLGQIKRARETIDRFLEQHFSFASKQDLALEVAALLTEVVGSSLLPDRTLWPGFVHDRIEFAGHYTKNLPTGEAEKITTECWRLVVFSRGRGNPCAKSELVSDDWSDLIASALSWSGYGDVIALERSSLLEFMKIQEVVRSLGEGVYKPETILLAMRGLRIIPSKNRASSSKAGRLLGRYNRRFFAGLLGSRLAFFVEQKGSSRRYVVQRWGLRK